MSVTPRFLRLRKPLLAMAAVAASCCAGALPARAGGAGEMRMPAENWTVPYSGSAAAIPACSDPGVTAKIASRFANAESSYWNSPLQIVSFADLHPIAFRPWGLDFIPRLFCTGTVVTSDGRRRALSYTIAEDTGIIGWGWGVEFCVDGVDRQRSYAPACRQARP